MGWLTEGSGEVVGVRSEVEVWVDGAVIGVGKGLSGWLAGEEVWKVDLALDRAVWMKKLG